MNHSGAILLEFKFMLILATLCSALLMLTRATVGERAELTPRTASAILEMLGEETIPGQSVAIDHFKAVFKHRLSGRIKLWQSVVKPELWACEATGNGMWAEITLVFVFNRAGRQIIGLRVVEQNETAGLGGLIAEETFCEQFADLHTEHGVEMAAARVMNNQFDAVSGATVSSRAVEKILNRALNALNDYN
ncbi:MAG: FMN-binding protein [Candidatus Riflebacteria bacterium]|nr:FMN-binding protein [Candidatus Riflebacteria bacterium]